VDKAVWKSFKNIIINFLGNHKADNYRDMAADLLKPYKTVGCNVFLRVNCNVPLRVNLLYSHLDFFAENLGELSDGHGVPFHWVISNKERRYQGKCGPITLPDYCSTLRRETPQAKYNRKSSTLTF
jgi:hypothetical protein